MVLVSSEYSYHRWGDADLERPRVPPRGGSGDSIGNVQHHALVGEVPLHGPVRAQQPDLGVGLWLYTREHQAGGERVVALLGQVGGVNGIAF